MRIPFSEGRRTLNTRTKPGSVTAVLVLLILIAVYQVVYGLFALLGAATVANDGLMEQMPPEVAEQMEAAQEMIWAAYLGAGLALLYGVVTIVLAVMVAKGGPRARGAAIGVNAVAGVALLVLMFTAVYGFGALISAFFAFTVVALLYNSTAKRYFAGVPTDSVSG